MPSDIFTVTYSPCGLPIYETEISDWASAGFPHPVTGSLVDPKALRSTVIREDDPANRYGMDYWMVALPDGTALRVLND